MSPAIAPEASNLGKTELAKSLAGSEPLVVSVEEAKDACLSGFDRDLHTGIVFDNANQPMDFIVQNRKVLQSSIDVVQLGQSRCQGHLYEVFLHRFPMARAGGPARIPLGMHASRPIRSARVHVERPPGFRVDPTALSSRGRRGGRHV